MSDWFYADDAGERFGPFPLAQVREVAAQRAIRVWKEGMADWQWAAQVPEIGGGSPPPPPLPVHQNAGRPPAMAGPGVVTLRTASPLRYPKWPWIGFAASLFLLVICWGLASSIEEEARVLLAEQGRMNSEAYVAEVTVESFLRGAMGDPFGKYNEESYKANAIDSQLAALESEYNVATGGIGLFFLGTLAFTGLWIWQHVMFRQTARARVGWK